MTATKKYATIDPSFVFLTSSSGFCRHNYINMQTHELNYRFDVLCYKLLLCCPLYRVVGLHATDRTDCYMYHACTCASTITVKCGQ